MSAPFTNDLPTIEKRMKTKQAKPGRILSEPDLNSFE